MSYDDRGIWIGFAGVNVGTNPLPLQTDEVARVTSRDTTGGSTLTSVLRSNGVSVVENIGTGVYYVFGVLYSAFTLSVSSNNIKVEYLPADKFLPSAAAGIVQALQSGAWTVGTKPLATEVDHVFVGPTNIAGATTEAVTGAGAANVGAGNRVYFSLSCETGPLTTAADTLTYIALKGHTSGNYYVVVGLGASETGFFDWPSSQAAEKLDIVTRNQDTVAHFFAGSFIATAV